MTERVWCLLCLITCLFVCSSCNSELQEIVTAIQRLVKYYKSNFRRMNLDGIFGLRVLQGQMFRMLQHRQPPDTVPEGDWHIQMRPALDQLLEETGSLANQSLFYLQQSDPAYYNQLHRLVQTPFAFAEPYRRIDPGLRWRPEVIKKRGFTEAFSDGCMGELLGNATHRPCQLSEECLRIMFEPGHSEYTLAHQLLYTVIAEQPGCLGLLHAYLARDGRRLEEVRHEFCTNMFYELAHMVQSLDGEIRPLLQDLFMEQEFVCAMMGFMEILHVDWLKQILQWQLPSGCYGKMPPAAGHEYLPAEVHYEYKGAGAEAGSEAGAGAGPAPDTLDARANQYIRSRGLLSVRVRKKKRRASRRVKSGPRRAGPASGPPPAAGFRQPLPRHNHSDTAAMLSPGVSDDRGPGVEWPTPGVSDDRGPGVEWPTPGVSGDRGAGVEWPTPGVSGDRGAGVEWPTPWSWPILDRWRHDSADQLERQFSRTGRKLLMEKTLEEGCLSHKTAVAAAALSQYLRYALYPGDPAFTAYSRLGGYNLLMMAGGAGVGVGGDPGGDLGVGAADQLQPPDALAGNLQTQDNERLRLAAPLGRGVRYGGLGQEEGEEEEEEEGGGGDEEEDKAPNYYEEDGENLVGGAERRVAPPGGEEESDNEEEEGELLDPANFVYRDNAGNLDLEEDDDEGEGDGNGLEEEDEEGGDLEGEVEDGAGVDVLRPPPARRAEDRGLYDDYPGGGGHPLEGNRDPDAFQPEDPFAFPAERTPPGGLLLRGEDGGPQGGDSDRDHYYEDSRPGDLPPGDHRLAKLVPLSLPPAVVPSRAAAQEVGAGAGAGAGAEAGGDGLAPRSDIGASLGQNYAVILSIMAVLCYLMYRFVRKRRVVIRYRYLR